MTRLRSVVPADDSDDLRAALRLDADSGQIWLNEHRMLLVHAEAQALLRKELIDSLGMERAQGLLMRMGYASGQRDAELARTVAQRCNDVEAFMTGPRLHTMEGIVQVQPVAIEIDRATGRFQVELLWHHSWEGEWHRHFFGTHAEPVCWTQIGYACGYASAFMGRPILFVETECIGVGSEVCRILGKPVDEWPDAERQMRFLTPEPIAERLLELQTQVGQLRSTIAEQRLGGVEMIGQSPGFRAACELVRAAAPSRIAVLLLGETGVGKELFARALHRMSPRVDKPFVAVNCAAIPHELLESELFGAERGAYTGAQVARPGRFERADGGTLFLDEIGDLPPAAQAKLLRVLQEGEVERLGGTQPRKVDVRVVAATHQRLAQQVKDGGFRSDLYYRLNAYEIEIPPLRERKEDISPLARHFLDKYQAIAGKKLRGFTDLAKRALLSYAWPGNVRELQNMIERGVLLAPGGGRIEASHLFPCSTRELHEAGLEMVDGLGGGGWAAGHALCEAVLNGVMTLDQIEAMLLETAVDKARGNLSSAARLLGLSRPQLAYRLKRLHEAQSAARGEETVPAAPTP
jgi:DNA-binding NtrC family response regulator